MEKKTRIFKIIWLILFFCLASTLAGPAQEMKLFRIGTGGKNGVYYPVGKLIARGITVPPANTDIKAPDAGGVPGYIGIAQNSAGSIENVRKIISKETEAGLVQADVALRAFKNQGVFEKEKNTANLRAVASLYPEKFHIVVRKDAGISKVTDLEGKHISLDEQGSGTLSVMRIVLEAYGLCENDLEPVYLKPEFTEDKIVNGELQGFVMMAGVPAKAILDLSTTGTSLIPVSSGVAEKIKRSYPYLVPGVIRENSYPDIPKTATIQVHALFAVNAETDSDLVYQVTKALWSPRTLSLLKEGHPQGAAITPETALKGLSIPLHEGARTFYEEHGFHAEKNMVQ